MQYDSWRDQAIELARRFLMRLALAASGLCAGLCLADEPETPPDAAPQAAQPPAAGRVGPAAPPQPNSAWPFDIWYLRGDDGRPVFVPDRARLRDYLDWLARENSGAFDPAPYGVESLACRGAADDERLQLDVDLVLRVLPTDEWVYVPLGMVEATLSAPPQHTGVGDAAAAPYHPDRGYGYWLRGAGEHRLSLALVVPLRKQGGARRLQLSLPEGTVSSLKLAVPWRHISVKAPERSILSVQEQGDKSTIDLLGLPSRLDLAWQQLPATIDGEAELEVTTALGVTLADRSATLEAVQRIQSLAQHRLFDTLRVTLLCGVDLLRLEGSDNVEYSRDPQSPDSVLVHLKKPTAGPIELRWTMRKQLPPPGEPFIVSGFDVDHARIHTGMVAVAVSENLRLSPPLINDSPAQRVNLVDLPASLRQPQTVWACRFVDRLSVPLALERVEPLVTGRATFSLMLRRHAAELAATWQLNVVQGSISHLMLDWPGRRTEDWSIESVAIDGRPVPFIDGDSNDGATVRCELPEGVLRTFEVQMHARRGMPFERDLQPLTLPVLQGAAQISTQLSVRSEKNLDVQIQSDSRTGIEPLEAAAEALNSEIHELFRREDYLVPESARRLLVSVAVRPQEIVVSTDIEAALRKGFAEIRQRIAYRVLNEKLFQATLRLPPRDAVGSVQFSLPSGARFSPVEFSPDGKTREVHLPAPGLGEFEFEVRYAIGLEAGQKGAAPTDLRLPFVQSADSPFSTTRLVWRDFAGWEGTVDQPGWVRRFSPDGQIEWLAAEPVNESVVRVKRSHASAHRLVVRKALLSTIVAENGAVTTHAEFRLSAPVEELKVAFPPGMRPTGFWWNRSEVRAVQEIEKSAEGAEYLLHLGTDGEANPLLTIIALSSSDSPGRLWRRYHLAAPAIGDDLPVLATYWQASLPFHQHLFVDPRGFANENFWHSAGLFWGRRPSRNAESLERWVGTSSQLTSAFDETGNVYLFSHSGSVRALQLVSMSQSAIVLVGAGMALLLGLVVVQWPASRHALSVVLAVFLVSLASVWFATPVRVLLQPALLGALFALFAAAFERFLKRRLPVRGVALHSLSGLSRPDGSALRGELASSGGDDYTASAENPPAQHALPHQELSGSGSKP